MIAEFEADLARARTREGRTVARAKGRLRGKQPKLSPRQESLEATSNSLSDCVVEDAEQAAAVIDTTLRIDRRVILLIGEQVVDYSIRSPSSVHHGWHVEEAH